MSWRKRSHVWAPTPQEQMKNTERAYLKNKRIQAKLDQDLYGPKGIETTKRFAIDELDDQRAMLEHDLYRMSREAQKNALLAESGHADDVVRTVKIDGNDSDGEIMDEAQFEFVEDEREQIRKQKLLGDFGKNFHGYISRPGQNTSSVNENKIKKEYSRNRNYFHQSSIKRTNPRVKRLLEVEKMKQNQILKEEIEMFSKIKNPQFDEGHVDPLQKVLRKHESRVRKLSTGIEFGRQTNWRPKSKRRESRRTALDDFNLLNVMLPKLTDRRATGVCHKDRRGVFVTEENKSQVLADLGILGSDENDNDRARKGSVWDLGDVSNTFAPDGNIRTALTMGVIDESIDEMKKSRYVKPDKPRFYDIEVSAHDIFSHQTGSRVGFSSRISSAV